MPEPSRSSGVELEPVTCWPLIVGAVGFVALGLCTVAGFAAWSALFPPQAEVAAAPAPAQPTPVKTERLDLPAQPLQATTAEHVVKVRREVIQRYTPPPRQPEDDRLPVPRIEAAPSRRPRSAPIPKRPPQLSTQTLLAQLWKQGIDLDLDSEAGTSKAMLEAGKKQLQLRRDSERERDEGKETAGTLTKTIRELLAKRSDLRGLPLLDEKSCQSRSEQAAVLRKTSSAVRRLQARRESGVPELPGPETALQLFLEKLPKSENMELLVRPLHQMFQIETHELRLALVDTLTIIKRKESTRALGERAVFDLAAEVRANAIEALRKRPLDEVRPIFLAALRHPWAPAAEHAAIALADLNDRNAIPALQKLVDAPDPRQPFQQGGKWFVCEVVRINHLRNCLLCHPPSLGEGSEPVIGPIPRPGEPLPVIYYDRGFEGDAVRADVVYFRQDFSVIHEVPKPGKWPKEQRFDYMVRTRELTSKEADAQLARTANAKTSKDKPAPPDYPQRKAVQYALHALIRQAMTPDR